MSETYIVTAKTVEEAMAVANREYGGSGKDISFDILEMPKKGFLGIGAKEAKIKVTVSETEDISLGSIVAEMKSYKMQTAKYEDGEERKAKQENKPAAKSENKQESRPDNKPKAKPENKPAQSKAESKSEAKPESKPAPKADAKQEKPAAKPEQPKSENKPAPKAEPKQEAKAEGKQENKPAAKPEAKPAPVAEELPVSEPAEAAESTDKSVKIGVTQAEMDYALSFTNTLLANMQLGATAKAVPCPEGETYEINGDANVYPLIEIEGDGTGILIGHHGETLDAIQYLLNLASVRRSGHGNGDYVKISLDIENYRSKREETLRALARRMAQRALKYKRNVFLEPMNAYERRIIHSELQGMENISTHSVGTDKNRKIIITYEGADKAPSDKNRSRRRGGKPEGAGGMEAPVKEAAENAGKKEEGTGEGTKSGGSRRRRHRSRNRGERPAEDKGAEAAATASAKREDRPRPPKPQKLPIEALPDFLASVEDEPAEHLREM